MMRSLDGDASAHRELLRALAQLSRGYFVRRLAGDTAAAEDLVQETLIAVHTRRAGFDRSRPFTPWAYAIARHKLVDHLRRRAANPAVPLGEAEPALQADAASVAAAGDLERLLRTLPSKQRRSIELAKIEGLSLAETAQRTGLSVAAVKVSIHRGLKALSASVRQGGSRRAD